MTNFTDLFRSIVNNNLTNAINSTYNNTDEIQVHRNQGEEIVVAILIVWFSIASFFAACIACMLCYDQYCKPDTPSHKKISYRNINNDIEMRTPLIELTDNCVATKVDPKSLESTNLQESPYYYA